MLNAIHSSQLKIGSFLEQHGMHNSDLEILNPSEYFQISVLQNKQHQV